MTCSWLQFHQKLIFNNMSENKKKYAIPLMQAKACASGTANILEYLSLNKGKLFRLFVFHAMPEQIALYNGNLPADLLRIPIPGKFQPTGSYNHTDKSGQLPKTETLRLRCS